MKNFFTAKKYRIVQVEQNGFIVSIVTFFVLTIMISVVVAISSLSFYRQQILTNNQRSTQSYYAAEGAVEDALVKLKKNPQMGAVSYALTINNATANVDISSINVAGSRTIAAQGDYASRIRNLQVVYGTDSYNVNFYYGIQVGAGGLSMGNGSEVDGNVFANGNITGSGTIDNNVVIAKNGNKLQGPHVEGNVLAYSCQSSQVDGNLTYVTGGTNTCNVHGSISTQSNEVTDQPLPIPQSQLDDWKAQAAAGTVVTGNVTISNGQKVSLGPEKITGNLTVSNNATLTLTGTVYVAGNISLSNNATVKLSSSYGSLGGVLMADGSISLSNNTIFSGSGQTGSYILVISNNTSNSAISVSNNANGAVLYTSAGGLSISNGVSLLEATGYKVTMSNNSKIQYSSGIENIYFSNGPGGGWKVMSWQEQ